MVNNLIETIFDSSIFQSGVLQALSLSIVGALIWEKWIRDPWKMRSIVRADKKSAENLLQYKPEGDGLIKLNQWSLLHPLKRRNHRVFIGSPASPQPYICEEKLRLATDSLKKQGVSGDICYLTGLQIDHNESESGKEFALQITPCDYAEHIAANKIYDSCEKTREDVLHQLRTDPMKYLESPVPSNITVNVVVLSRTNFLAIKRSKSVDTAKGEWVPGAAETMTLKDSSPGDEETLFSLARRCLKEELNLDEDMYGDINFSWFGLSEVTLGALAIAIVRLKDEVTEGQVIELAQDAHSSFESDDFDWVPFNKSRIKKFVQSETQERMGKKWIYFSKLSLVQALRYNPLFH